MVQFCHGSTEAEGLTREAMLIHVLKQNLDNIDTGRYDCLLLLNLEDQSRLGAYMVYQL